MVTRDENLWIAQGLEIDHVAQGSSLAEVKQLFQEGFLATVNEHLKRFNSIEGMLVGAPREVLLELDDLLNITGGDDEVKRGVVMRFAHKFRISVLEFRPSKHIGESE